MFLMAVICIYILYVYSLTVEDGSWSTPMVPAQLSVPLQQVEEWAPKPVRWTMFPPDDF